MNKLIWESKVTNRSDYKYPDKFFAEIGSKPVDDFIVSYTKNGDIASRYSDIFWDYTAYSSRGKHGVLKFSTWCKNDLSSENMKIIDEMKWILFLLIYIQDTTRLSVSTLQQYITCLNFLAKYALKKKVSIAKILSSPVVLLNYIDTHSEHKAKPLSALVTHLVNLGEDKIGFSVLDGATNKILLRKSHEYMNQRQQHSPIPTRIYSQIISALIAEIDDFSKVYEAYASLVIDCSNDCLFGRAVETQKCKAKKLNISFPLSEKKPTFEELLHERGLTDYFNNKELTRTVGGLSKGLNEVQFCCKLLIQIFSGMRHEECTYLPWACLETFIENNKEHFLITAKTTKLGIKETKWITSKEGAKAIKVAQNIADIRYNANYFEGKKNQEQVKYLFVSFGGLLLERNPGSGLFPNTFHRSDYSILDKRVLPIINHDDIRELEKISPYYNYGDEYAVGSRWPLKSHQFRRSLALYASRSGLVSLPSLRRQLQHITQEMAKYYAKGSVWAKNIIGEDDENHFGIEYQNTQSESQALAYISNVLLSDEDLFGAHGTFISRQSLVKEFNIQKRENTIKLFKKGEMSFKETTLGGCTKTGPCDKKAMRSIIACIECKGAIIKASKLSRLIKVQKIFVKNFEKDSYEYRIETSDLEALQSLEKKIAAKSLIKSVAANSLVLT